VKRSGGSLKAPPFSLFGLILGNSDEFCLRNPEISSNMAEYLFSISHDPGQSPRSISSYCQTFPTFSVAWGIFEVVRPKEVA
jgi:hypothetical protein